MEALNLANALSPRPHNSQPSNPAIRGLATRKPHHINKFAQDIKTVIKSGRKHEGGFDESPSKCAALRRMPAGKAALTPSEW